MTMVQTPQISKLARRVWPGIAALVIVTIGYLTYTPNLGKAIVPVCNCNASPACGSGAVCAVDCTGGGENRGVCATP